MKLDLHMTLTVLSGILLAGLVTGCTFLPRENIARDTTSYNLVAERAGNEMLLLNIVRASERRPMYFTSFGKLTGNLSYELGTGDILIPFGGTEGQYYIGPRISYRTSPLFDLGVLDTQEFTCGIMSPLSMTTVEYYWRQGWPKEMLLYLFINRIEIYDPNGELRKPFNNTPEHPDAFREFQEQIATKNWVWDIVVDPDPEATKIGDVDATTALQLKDLIETEKAGLRVTTKKENNRKELHLGQVRYVFRRTWRGAGEAPTSGPVIFGVRDLQRGNRGDKSQGAILLRSPEAILYYLGEILRVELQARGREQDLSVPVVCSEHAGSETPPAWLFYACKATDKNTVPCAFCTYEAMDKRARLGTRKATDENTVPCPFATAKTKDNHAGPPVSVNYEGTRYIIPGELDTDYIKCTDRSMHTLSLVSQLIGMQKKSQQLPATGVVTVIGR